MQLAKVCSKCQEEKTLNKFYKQERGKYGVRANCKDCQDKAIKPIRKAQTQRLYQRRKDEILAKQREYRRSEAGQANRRQTKLKYRNQNTEQIRLYQKAYRGAPENRTKLVVHRQRREALRRGAEGTYTADEWRALCDHYGNKCLACGEPKPLTVDHVIPLSKGGSNDISNLQPLCGSCNSIKRDKAIDYRSTTAG